MQNFKILWQIFNFFTPQYLIVQGVGVSIFFNWNVILSVTQDRMRKFKILRQIFNFFTPQYLIVPGGRGGLDFFLIGMLFYR